MQLDPPRLITPQPDGGGIREIRKPRDDLPVLLKTRQVTASTAHTYTVLEAMKNVGGVRVLGGKLDLKGAADKAWVGFSFGDDLAIASDEVAAMLDRFRALSGIADVTLRWNRLWFETGRAFCAFAEQAGLDWERLDWDHDSHETR